MQSHNHNGLYFGSDFNFATHNLLVVQSQDQSAPFPPVEGNFELLDGTPFLLLDGTNFLLL